MIKKFERKIKKEIIYKVFCDKCGEEMHSTGLYLPSIPGKYQYECPKCKYVENISEEFLMPDVEYIEKEIKED